MSIDQVVTGQIHRGVVHGVNEVGLHHGVVGVLHGIGRVDNIHLRKKEVKKDSQSPVCHSGSLSGVLLCSRCSMADILPPP